MRGAFENITVRRKTSTTVNSEGLWTPVVSNTVVRGSLHQKFSEEGQPGELGQYGERRKLIARIPKNSTVSINDQIVISGNAISGLNATYTIEGIVYTKTHIRLEIRKTVGDE
jgi:hypothetical protein